jgi:hypothetical protein
MAKKKPSVPQRKAMRRTTDASGYAKPWHELPPEDMGPYVARIVDGYKTEQSGRRARHVRNLEQYEGRHMAGYSAHTYVGSGDNDTAYTIDRLKLVRSAVESAVANIYAPQKPKPQFQTLGATWATRRKAYRLDRICEGVLNQRQGRWINVWAFMADAGAECALQGVAAVKVTANIQKKRIDHELVALPDLFVDPAEGRNPQNLFQRAPIDEFTALQTYPKFESAVRGAKQYEWYGRASSTRPRATKVIEIVYAWHLPVSDDTPGRWAAVINGTVVDSGEWTAPSYPFVFFVWEPHRDGFWASGICDTSGQLAEECSELDKRLLYREIVASGKRVYYQRDSINPDELALNDASVAVAVEAGAEPPTESLSVPFSPMELDYLKTRVGWFWDANGLSQVSAAARREQGVSSGIAMLTLNDTKAGRQLVKAQRYEQAYVDLAHQYVWRLRELAEDDPEFVIKWPGKAMLRTVKWADAEMKDEEFSVAVAPSSALPHDPAGRQEMVQDMYKSSLISQETAKMLIGWPDLDSELDVENAESEYIDSLIEAYLDADPENWNESNYQAPEGFIANKAGALRRFASAWFRARIDQRTLPKEEQRKAEFNIGLLARWMQEIDGLMTPPPPTPGQVTPDQLAPPPHARETAT